MIAKNSFYRLTPLAVAMTLLSACSSAPVAPTYVIQQPAPVKTLANLDTSAIAIIDDASFKTADTTKSKTGGRSADVVAEYLEANQRSPHSLDAMINKQLNDALYERLVADAKKAGNPSTATAYLNVARRLKTSSTASLEEAERELLNKNIAFYQDLLERTTTDNGKADIYYELAKNYDLLTQKTSLLPR